MVKKKGPTKGSGGQKPKRLAGKGPTPKAENRPYHAAAKRKSAPKRTNKRVTYNGELVTGRNAVLEALREGVPATELIVARSIDVDDRVEESLRIALNKRIEIREINRADLEALSANTQGIALGIKPYQYSSLEEILSHAGKPGLIVALDGVTDPRNLGAIVRSAAAFGADGVVITERRAAAMTAAAWKSSAGAAARMKIAQVTNLNRAIESVQGKGYFVVGLDGDANEEISNMKVATEPLMLIVGSEGEGLHRLVSEKCDLVVKIPMRATTESLNASVAASIALYAVELARS